MGGNLQKGVGIKRDLEEAAIYYKRALNNGYFEAKKHLDNIYDRALKFKS